MTPRPRRLNQKPSASAASRARNVAARRRNHVNNNRSNLDPLARIVYTPELSVDTIGGISGAQFKTFLKEPQFFQQTSLHTFKLHYDVALSSDPTGSITNVFGETPNSSPDWVNLANSFDKYRVIGFQMKFYPNNRYSKTTTTCTPIVISIDRDDPTSLTSYSQASEAESAVEKTLEDPWSFYATAQNGDGLSFRDTLSATQTYYIKLFSTGLTVSTTYGRLMFSFLVQYQGLSR